MREEHPLMVTKPDIAKVSSYIEDFVSRLKGERL